MARWGRSFPARPHFGPRSLALQNILYDATSTSGYQTVSATYNWNHTCSGNNRELIVGISMLSVAGSSVSSITYNGVALSLIGARASISGAVRAEMWGLVNPPAGTYSIAVTLSAALDSIGNAVSFQNVQQSTPTEAENDASATNVGAADATVNVTTIADNDWTVDVVASDDTAITVGAGQVSQQNVSGTLGSGAMSTEGPDTPPGSVTMNWTGVGALATWSIVSVGVRPLSASVTVSATIAASDSSDTASITAANWTAAQIAATETSDTASINAGATTPATIAATESSDTAAINAAATTPATIAATESSDTAAIVAEVTTGAEIAATESSDNASITASAITSGQIAATESSDTASITVEVTTGAAIAASESSDTAAIIAATITTAQIVATESSDITSISAEATTSAAIAATESSDTAAIVADASGVLSASIDATESSDTTAISASATTGAVIDATESSDTASIVGSGGAVDTGVSHGPIPPRQRPFLAPIIGHAHTGQAQTVRATVTLKLVVSIKTAQVQSVEGIADQSMDVVAMTEQAHRIGWFGWARMLTSARTAQAPPLLSAMLAQEMQTKIVSGIFDREVPSYDAPERIVFRDVA